MKQAKYDNERVLKKVKVDLVGNNNNNNGTNLKLFTESQFKKRFPDGYEIKTWSYPDDELLKLIQDIMEVNVDDAIEQVFNKYHTECEKVFVSKNNERYYDEKVVEDEILVIKNMKRKLLFKIIEKIILKLSNVKIPSRVKSQFFDLEYLLAKQEYIKQEYANILENTEHLEEKWENIVTRNTDGGDTVTEELKNDKNNGSLGFDTFIQFNRDKLEYNLDISLD
ncbi:Okp1p SCDLUD_004482 [Saccharomycodes ludwigii]|uniref:Okp1p n=1 Tax=Saccharomycodes ludwigii TaxID=36035 RepID=UPI001E83E2D6|nr:hypothetical protein SCDLUD_004482 [Saccharomycodes ludwigii]KAH3899060.1 hypothetical protein SCDLUD_004482 [Saccharomycodes ludwigii]